MSSVDYGELAWTTPDWTTNGTTPAPSTQAAQPVQDQGTLSTASLQFLAKLVDAFDYSNLDSIQGPMRGISASIGQFRPMSLWTTSNQGDLSIEGIENWLAQCAIASEQVRGSAVVGLQRLALASGRLTSLLRLVHTTRQISTTCELKHTRHFISYLFSRVEEAAKDCLFLPVTSKWECEECTALNDANDSICTMCMSPQGGGHSAASSLRSKTGSSLSAPIPPASEITTYQSLSNNILMVLAQLAKYRLGSSLNGVTTKFEPFLVDISPETFELFAHLISALVEEKEDEQEQEQSRFMSDGGLVAPTAETKTKTKTKTTGNTDEILLHLMVILKLNIRRQRECQQGTDIDLSLMNKLLAGIELRNLLPPTSNTLAEVGAVRLELAIASGIAMVVKLMRDKPDLMAVQASGCLAMYEQILSSGDGGVECATHGGVHATITAIVKAHNTGHIEVLVPGLRVLSRLKDPCCYGKHTMGDLDNILNITLSIMKRNFRNVEIQLMTLRIIINLSEHSAGDAQVLETKAHRSCAFLTSEANTIVPIVTESLHAHANEKDIQLEGCKILYILSTNAENVSILSNYGGIGAARTIIAAGESNPVLQRMGLSVLGVLMTSGNQNLTEIIPPKDVLKCMVMFNVASNGRQEAQLMHERCLSLIYHLMLNPVTKAQALRHDAQNITDLSMQTFVDSFDVQRYGALIIAECLKGQSNDALKLFDLNVAHLICLAFDMSQKTRHPDVQEGGKQIGRAMLKVHLQLLQVLPTVARLNQIATKLTAKRICTCMLKYPNEAELQHEGIWCIEYITPTQRDEITKANGLRAIVNAMRRIKLNAHKSNRSLYEHTQLGGCIAIMSICDERGGGRGKRARKAGAVEAIRSACEYFHANSPRTAEHFTAAKSTLKRMDKKCSIV